MSFAKRIIEQQQASRIMANANRGIKKPYQGVGMFHYDVFGDEQINQLFLSMDWTYQRRVIVSAFRKSAKPMIDAMKQGIQSNIKNPSMSTGNLVRSIGAYAPRNVAGLDVGARKFKPWAGHHAHLMETGTKERFRYKYSDTKKKGATGKQKPTFFFAKAIQATQDQVIASFQQDRLEAFDKMVEKANTKAKS